MVSTTALPARSRAQGGSEVLAATKSGRQQKGEHASTRCGSHQQQFSPLAAFICRRDMQNACAHSTLRALPMEQMMMTGMLIASIRQQTAMRNVKGIELLCSRIRFCKTE